MESERSEIEDSEDAPVEILPKEVRLAEDGDDTLPNTLVITVLQARHLQPSPLRSTLSCYVKLSSLGVEYKTSVMTKTREPRWHEVFVFRAIDWTTNVTVSVRDRLPFKMHFLGQVAIPSADIANLPGMITRRWFRLRDKGITGQFTGAELELKVALVYTKANDQSLSQTGPAAMELQHGVDAALADLLVGQDDETEEEAVARTKALLRRETQEREASAALASLKQGDYQVQVHIIEARDLKGENLSGTSDPYCQVEILGKSRKTATKYDTLGCVFDEILFFNFPNIGRHELREASINISVYDKERILKDNLIGIYQLDCLSVYAQPDHELYRQWIAVHDNLNEKDRGIQGFLLVSVVVLGPGDALRVHDREAEMELELTEATGEKAADDSSPTTTSPLVLVPPTIELKLQFLVVRVLRAEHLPAMDSGLFIGAPGIDAFLQVVFAANAPCKSSVVTVKGRGQLAPDFYEELWLPVRIPTFSRHIGLSIWDRDLTSPNELVGVASHDFLQVPADFLLEGLTSLKPPGSPQKLNLKLEDSEEETETEYKLTETGMREKLELEEAQQQIVAAAPRWYNLYGPPLHGTNSKRKQLVSRHTGLGSTYRGRVLLSMVRMESPKPEDGEKMHVKSMSEPDRERFEKMIPQTVKYMLRGALYSGVELSRSSSPTITGKPPQVRVKLSIGPYSINFESEEVAKDGTATFEQCLDHRSALVLPADLTQIPDIIVTLSRTIGGVVSTSTEEFVSVSFARFRAEDVFARSFTAKPQWVVLREEITRRQTRHALETSQSPGVLLLKLGFGRLEMATRHPWVNETDSSELFAPFRSPRVHREIRVHVFQARGLEASIGVARVPSPAVNVRCCGQQKRTKTCPTTPAPLFYETLVFLTNVPASDVAYTPEILFQVQDMSGSGVTAILGELRLSLASAVCSVATAGSPKPRWYELKRPRSRSSTSVSLLLAEQAGGGAAGQVLIAIQYIDHPGLTPPAVLRQPAPIIPKYTEANLDIVALGVRHLKALSTLGIRRPHVEFELVGGFFVDNSKVKRIESFIPPNSKWKRTESDKPTGCSISSKNANFLDRIVAHVKLPVDTLYAPQLQIRVCDSTIGGLRKTTLASCIVDLAPKLPWSPTYRVEIAAGSGSPFRSPSRRKQKAKGQEWWGNLEDEDEFDEFLLDEDQPEEEITRFRDDGVGVGDLHLPSVSYAHARVSNVLTLDTDPALFEQRRREEQRRYNAGKSALLLSHRIKNQGAALESPKNSEQPRVPYFQGRDWWISQYGGEELENYFTTPALESYQLKRPVLSRPSLLSFERVRVLLRAGVFKGRITVIERRTRSDSRSPEQERAKQESLELRRLQNGPQSVVVRVYVLRGQNLHAKSSNSYPDPYLRLKLGSDRINDQANACTNTLQPEFFRVFALETTLPGASQLDISVWDRGLISDQLIGSTTIDLEERWFHREWQEIGDDPSAGKPGNQLKPIEYRHLYVPQNRTTSQGFLQLWVDILTSQEAVRIKPVDISPPEPKLFEVRVVVWRAENVQDQVQSEINDYFVKAWMENSDSGSEKAESTDTHWRCSNGKPCWNWRLILKTEFPPRSPEMARLHLQLWDKDVLKWNDVLGEAQLDLYKWLRRAYETNRSVAPFLELKRLSQHPEGNIDAKKEGSEDTDEDSSEEFYEKPSEEEEATGVKLLPREQSSLLDKTSKKSAEKKQKRPESSASTRKLAKTQKNEAEAEAALSGLLDFMGLGRLPDDAEWIPIYFTDREAAVSMEMGRIGISLQIVPEDEAVASPVGKGQNTPNLNPYLPPPVGRMRLTANPIAMFKVLVGPKMCLRLSLLCCCFGCIAFISVFGATVMSTLTYLQSVKARHSHTRP